MKRTLPIYVLLLLTLISCREVIDIPDPIDPDPVFGTTLVIDGRETSFVAGLNNYHIKPEFLERGKDLIFKSTFKPKDCDNDCRNSLSFTIYSNLSRTPDFDINKAITPGSKRFQWQTVRDSQYVVVKEASMGAFDQSIFSYKGQKVSALRTGTETKLTIPRDSGLELCLTNRSTINGSSSQCQYLINRNQLPPRVNLRIKDARAIILTAEEIQPFDRARAMFHWSTGETGSEIKIAKDKLINNEICVNVSYPDQRKSRNCMLVKSLPDRFDLVSQFAILGFEEIMPSQADSRGLVVIEYIDENGNHYRSNLHRQNFNQFFDIYSIEDYYDEVTDMNLKKLVVGFQCELFGNNSQSVKLRSDSTSIAIRYPG